MDRQQECTMETLRRIKRDLNLPQGFIDEAIDRWDDWSFASRRIHIHVYSMIALMKERGATDKEALKAIEEFLGALK